jgi:molybdopterin-binding protein
MLPAERVSESRKAHDPPINEQILRSRGAFATGLTSPLFPMKRTQLNVFKGRITRVIPCAMGADLVVELAPGLKIISRLTAASFAAMNPRRGPGRVRRDSGPGCDCRATLTGVKKVPTYENQRTQHPQRDRQGNHAGRHQFQRRP